MTQVGYEVEGLALIVLAGLALFGKAGVGSSTGLKIALIVAAAAVQLILPLLGHRAMLRTLRALIAPFIVLFIVLTILSVDKVDLGAGTNGTWQAMFAALAVIVSAGGYGWVMNANDFSRYLPPNASPTQDRRLGRDRRLHPVDAAVAARRGAVHDPGGRRGRRWRRVRG